MKRLVFLFACCLSTLFAKEATEITKLSEAIGHLIRKQLHTSGLSLDRDALLRGLVQECDTPQASLSDEECAKAFEQLQELAFTVQAERNLAEANAFLIANAEKPDVISLLEGKIQYTITKTGTGDEIQSYNSPLLRYTGHYLNGESVGLSLGDEVITLSEALPGLSKGIQGMREGEIRTLYIHPDLGYGCIHDAAPNALLIFEIEVLKADASFDAHTAQQMEDFSLMLQ